MAIDSYKVSTTEVNTYNVKSAPDMLTSDAQTNKNWFDRLGEYFISKYNGLIDYLANNLTGRDGTGRGLKYEDGKVHWQYAVEPTDSFGFSYSGNIQPSDDGYDTPLTNDITLSVSDMMDCFLIVNNVEYQCEDAYQDGGLIRTKTYINGVEILLTYSTLSRDLVMSHATNPLDTTYWNVECYKSRADKVLAKSLPGNLTNAAYTELKDRIDRITGLTGKTITYTIIEYGVSNDEATPPAAWQPNPPATTQGQWLWVKSTTVFTDGTEDTIYTKSYIGTDGEDGISVTVQSVEKHDTTTTIKLVDSDGNVSTITLEDGEDGDNGLPGANGYVHLAWANSADGSVDFSTSISYGKDYLGTYSDNTEADSQDYHDYSWTYIRGMQGEQGEPGEPGEPGTGVAKIQPQYYLSTSPNSTIGGTWTTTLNYVSGYYIWTRDEITYDDGTIDHSEAVYNKALTEACTTSYNTAQYFWVKSDSGTQNVPTGAYVTKVSRDTYDVTNPQGNSLLLRDSGVFVRSNEKTCAAYLGSGMRIYDPSSTATYDSTLGVKVGRKAAEFTSTGVDLYDPSSTYKVASFTNSGVDIYRNGISIASFGSGARIGSASSFHINVGSGYIAGVNSVGTDNWQLGTTLKFGGSSKYDYLGKVAENKTGQMSLAVSSSWQHASSGDMVLEAGTYIVTAYASIPQGTSPVGNRGIRIYNVTDSKEIEGTKIIRTPTTNESATELQTTAIISVTGATRKYYRIELLSGGSSSQIASFVTRTVCIM